MGADVNPYAAPQAVTVAVSPPAAGLYFRAGRLLGVRDRAELPDVCVITNTAGDPKRWRKQRIFTSSPPWAWLGILGGPLILLLLMALAQRKAKVTYSLCRQSHRRILTRHLTALAIAFGSFSLGLGLGFAGLVPNRYEGYLLIATVLGIVAGAFLGVLGNPLKVVSFRNGVFLIKGCSPDFLATLPKAPPDARR